MQKDHSSHQIIPDNEVYNVNDGSTFEMEEEPFRPHLGNNCVFMFRNGEPLITIGPHWPLSICLLTIILIGAYFIDGLVMVRKGVLQRVCSLASAALLWTMFAITVCKNPGISTAWTRQPYREGNCKACNTPRLPGTVHCYDCDICVKGQDHHCPWTGKCIGAGNLRPFQMFICALLSFFIVNFAELLV